MRFELARRYAAGAAPWGAATAYLLFTMAGRISCGPGALTPLAHPGAPARSYPDEV